MKTNHRRKVPKLKMRIPIAGPTIILKPVTDYNRKKEKVKVREFTKNILGGFIPEEQLLEELMDLYEVI